MLRTTGWPSKEYRIPEYTEFMVPGNFFEYEVAYLKEGTINPYIQDVSLPYYANHIKWVAYIHDGNLDQQPLQYNYLSDDIKRKVIRVKNYNENSITELIKEYKLWDSILSDKLSLHSFTSHKEIILRNLIRWVSGTRIPENNYFFLTKQYINNLLNEWSQEKRLKFLTYLYRNWLCDVMNKKRQVSMKSTYEKFHMGFYNNGFYSYFGSIQEENPLYKTNLEATPMKRIELTQLDQQLLLLNKEKARQKLYHHNKSLNRQQIKEYINNLWLEHKKEKTVVEYNSKPITIQTTSGPLTVDHKEHWGNQVKKAYQVSYAKGNRFTNGMPDFEITNTIYGFTLKGALKRYKINPKSVLWVRQVINSTSDKPEFVELIPHRKLPLQNRIKKQKSKFVRKFKQTNQIKYSDRPDKLICLLNETTKEVIRIPRKDILLYGEDWALTSKSKYKEQNVGFKIVTKPKKVKVLLGNTICKTNNSKTGASVLIKTPITYRKNGKEYSGFTYKRPETLQQQIKNSYKLISGTTPTKINRRTGKLTGGKPFTKWVKKTIYITEPLYSLGTVKVRQEPPAEKPMKQDEKRFKKLQKQARQRQRTIEKKEMKRYKLNRTKNRYVKSPKARREVLTNQDRRLLNIADGITNTHQKEYRNKKKNSEA